MSKDKKKQFVDDGHTVFSMDGVENPVSKQPVSRNTKDSAGLSKKERRAAVKAAFATYLPIFCGVIACFTVAVLLVFLWLK